jgi:hypothetical protein
LNLKATNFPEAKVLIPIDSVTDKSNTPTSKSVVVTIHLPLLVIPNISYRESIY